MKDKIIRYRTGIVSISVLISILSVLFYPRLTVNSSLEEFVPEHSEHKVHLRKLDSIYGGSEVMLVMLYSPDVVNIATLERLKSIADDLGNIEGIDRCISPYDATEISYEDGFMVMDPFMEALPESGENMEAFKRQITGNRMASQFFSEDFSLVSIILSKNVETSDSIIDEIKRVIASHPGEEEVFIGGLPYIRYSITSNIRNDLALLIPLAMLLMVFMLYISFREWKGVFMPLSIVAMSIIISFGIMGLLGWQISLMSILLPIMLIAIANNYGIHMIARYQELIRNSGTLSMTEISKQIYTDLKRPIIITGLTTIGGILGLVTHTMIPAAQLGIVASLGIGIAMVLSIWFLPALLSFFKRPKNPEKYKERKIALADLWLKRFSRWIAYHPKRIVFFSTIIAVLGLIGIFFIEVDTNIESYFTGKSEVHRSTKLINEKFGGSQYLSVLFYGDVLMPEVLERMEEYEQIISQDPAVGKISSPVTLLKELSKGFYVPGEDGYNRIPESADEAYQFIEVFAMGGNQDAVEQFIDYEYQYARMIISLKDGSNSAAKRLLAKITDLTRNNPDVEFIAGASLIKIALADMVVQGQIKSLILALVVVFILLSLIFKSLRAGLLASLPLSVAIFVLFGLMGLFGIDLDIATALSSSIMIGVGVDYTIHFLWRFKIERAKGTPHKEAAQVTLSTTGRGIFFNAIAVITGFLVLTISNFAPLRFFGALVVISITVCLISALLLVPAIVILIKPKFLDKK